LLAGIFYLSSEQLFLVLFGSKWHLSAIYFKILVIAGFSYPLSSLSLSIIEARGNSKSFFIVELIKKALFLPTYFIAFYWGIIPFLLSSVFVMYLSTFMNIRFLKYELDISIWQTIKYLSAYYIPTLFSVLLVEMLNFPTSLQETVIEVFLKVGLFIFIYIFINIKIKNKGFNYSLDLIRN
jgi:O-antigen/teichoic acid export membrane protein